MAIRSAVSEHSAEKASLSRLVLARPESGRDLRSNTVAPTPPRLRPRAVECAETRSQRSSSLLTWISIGACRWHGGAAVGRGEGSKRLCSSGDPPARLRRVLQTPRKAPADTGEANRKAEASLWRARQRGSTELAKSLDSNAPPRTWWAVRVTPEPGIHVGCALKIVGGPPNCSNLEGNPARSSEFRQTCVTAGFLGDSPTIFRAQVILFHVERCLVLRARPWPRNRLNSRGNQPGTPGRRTPWRCEAENIRAVAPVLW